MFKCIFGFFFVFFYSLGMTSEHQHSTITGSWLWLIFFVSSKIRFEMIENLNELKKICVESSHLAILCILEIIINIEKKKRQQLVESMFRLYFEQLPSDFYLFCFVSFCFVWKWDFFFSWIGLVNPYNFIHYISVGRLNDSNNIFMHFYENHWE